MRELYNKFFRIPENERICEKVMISRVIMTVSTICVCLAAMSISAYAYFSYNVASAANVIKVAHFEIRTSIQITDENGETVNINPITSNYQTYKAELQAGKSYTVTITPTEKSTATTGFIVVTAKGCEKTYHTQQLGVDTNSNDGETESISFKLMVTDKTDVHFLAHWGTSAYYDAYKNKGENNELYIIQNEEIKMIVNGYEEPNISVDNGENANDEDVNSVDDTLTAPPQTESPDQPADADNTQENDESEAPETTEPTA